MSRAPLAAFALLLLAPVGVAGAAPVEADVATPEAARWDGAYAVASSRGVLDLAAASGVPALRWESATGWLVERTFRAYGPWDRPVVSQAERVSNRSLALGPGALEAVTAGGAIVFGEVGGSGSGSLAIARAGEAEWFAVGPHQPHWQDYFALEVPAGAWVASLPPAQLRATGEVGVFLHGARADLVVAAGRERLETGVRHEPNELPREAGHDVVDRFVVLHLRGARFDAGETTGARWLGAAPTWSVDGSVAAERASGWIRVGNERRELADARVLVEGTLSGSGLDAPGGLALAKPLRLHLAGSSARVLVDGALVEPSLAERAAPATARGAVALLAVAALALLPWSAFYSRIRQEEVLLNRNRRRLFDEVAARPGQSVGGLARVLGLAEGVVRYHLETLEKRRLVATRRVEGVRVVVPAELGTTRLVWRRPGSLARQKVAACVRNATGLTQAQIADQTGLSQRLVSYHLSALERAGEVEALGVRPQRYASVAASTDASRMRPLSGQSGEPGSP